MRFLRNLVFVVPIILAIFAATAAHAAEYYLYGLGGGGRYHYKGERWDGPAVGFGAGAQASDPLGFEFNFEHVSIGRDSYYFGLLATRYRFLDADFFMEPSIDFHVGLLVPSGEKTDIDGVMGAGVGFLYRTHYNIEFGPRLESTLVFAGPNRGVMLGVFGVVGYRFK